MKAIYTLVILSFFTALSAQSDWTEYLFHEKFAQKGDGFLELNDDLIVVASNGKVRKIIGNQKAEVLYQYDPYHYQTIKRTKTGENSEEILLLEAFDYDIPGFGLTSLRNNEGEFWAKSQFGSEEFDIEFQSVRDGLITPDESVPDYVINYDGSLSVWDGEQLLQIDPSPWEGFHEGLNGENFVYRNDSLFRLNDLETTFVFKLENGFDELRNHPDFNALVVRKGNSIKWYRYGTFENIRSGGHDQSAIDYSIINDGVISLLKDDEIYKLIFLYLSGPILVFEHYAYDPLDLDYEVTSLSTNGSTIYLIGTLKDSLSGVSYHYIQKHKHGSSFIPERQDLSLDVLSLSELGNSNNEIDLEYTFTVTNVGNDTINSFAVSSDNLPVFHFDYSIIRHHFDITIPPGESFTYTDTAYATPASLANGEIALHITGVNYGIDNDFSNNTYVGQIKVLSNEEISLEEFVIYPNPTNGLLNLQGLSINDVNGIYDMTGRRVDYHELSDSKLDLSHLPSGIYLIHFMGNDNTKYIKVYKS